MPVNLLYRDIIHDPGLDPMIESGGDKFSRIIGIARRQWLKEVKRPPDAHGPWEQWSKAGGGQQYARQERFAPPWRLEEINDQRQAERRYHDCVVRPDVDAGRNPQAADNPEGCAAL